MNRTAIALAGFLAAAAAASAADPAPASRPADSANGLQLVQVIQTKDVGGSWLGKGGAYHVGPVAAVGDDVYVASHYQGKLKHFRRDPATGELSYADDLAFAKNDMSISDLTLAGGRLYFRGGSGHEDGPWSRRGLHWLDINPKSGSLTVKGSLDIPLAAGLVAGAGGKQLYVLSKLQPAVCRYTLAADGTPTKAEQADLNGLQGRPEQLTIAADGRTLYFLTRGSPKQAYALHAVQIKPDGALGAHSVSPLPELTAGADWPAGQWGFGVTHGYQISPDGRHLYAFHANYGKAQKDSFRLALYRRDANADTFTFDRRLDFGHPSLQMLVFEPDGKRGYFAASRLAGWSRRDPATGALTVGGIIGIPSLDNCSNLCLDPKAGCVYGATWTSRILFVLSTPPRDAQQ